MRIKLSKSHIWVIYFLFNVINNYFYQLIDSSIKKTKEKEKDIDSQTSKISSLNEELKELKSKYAYVQGKLNILRTGKLLDLQKKIKDLNDQNDILKGMLKSMKRDISTKDIGLK